MPFVERSQHAKDSPSRIAAANAGQSDRWLRVKELFMDALQCSDSERDAFLSRATSGDPELRREIDSLFTNDEAAKNFCETPAAALLGSSPSAGADERSQLSDGARLGSYQITSFIAAGGMGAVYRARHTVLGRDVAIKTLGRGASDDEAKRRLIREARNASSLEHPNICTIYDVGEADGVPFIVMEYVGGSSLARIIRDGRPDLSQSCHYAMQIAAALDYAHRHGIIHRDLKSSNVVIDDDDEAVVLDFGLAQRTPDAGSSERPDSTATNRDAFAGTLSHMAPELLRGERGDARSDVWALGVLLYQLLTGNLPFVGRTPFEACAAILAEAPAPMSVHVPLALRLIVDRCLAKDPRRRYQRAGDVGDALAAARRRTWSVVGHLLSSTRHRALLPAAAAIIAVVTLIAVTIRGDGPLSVRWFGRATTLALLPLTSPDADSSAAYYADGITDALIAQLGATSDVHVLSRASTRRVAATGGSPAAIGSRLGADLVVLGVLHRTSSNVSIALRLVRRSDARILWSDSLARTPAEVLALEADVVRAVAGAIRVSARPGASERLSAIRAVRPDVYEAYLKGRYAWSKRTPRSLQRAIAYFTQAIELDETYAPAHAGLADCYNQLGTVMIAAGSPHDLRLHAEAEAIKALQIDPFSAEAHAALGFARHYDLRWPEAEHEFRRAIELNPSFALAHVWYANFLASRSRMKEALTQMAAARELDPFSLVVNTNMGWVLDETGRPEAAIAELTQTLTLDSNYVQARWRLAVALLSAQRVAEAQRQVTRLITLTDSAPPVLALLAIIDARAGQQDAARAILRDLQSRARGQYVPASSIAQVQAAVGDMNDAMTSMEKAFAEGSNSIAYLAVAREYEPMRRDPRFTSLLKRAGL